MRIIVSAIVLLTTLFSGGCAILENETRNRGGYLDHVVDSYWWKADSKGMRALRAFALQVSLARVASVSSKNESDRQLLAIRIGALTKRFLPVYNCAFDNNPLRPQGAEREPCFYYDSAMVDYSTGLFDLAVISLPIDDAKRLVSTVTGSVVNPLNIADLLDSLLTLGKDALKYGRVVGALYRDTVELEVQLWLSTPAWDDRPPPYRVTEADVAPLREIYSRRNDDMPAWLDTIAALRSRGLEPLAHPRFFDELGGLMRYICDLITRDKDASDRCKVGLPTTQAAPMTVLGASFPGRLGMGTSAGGADSATTRQTGGGGTKKDHSVDPQPAKTTSEILLALMRAGDGETRKATRASLQAMLQDSSIKPLLVPPTFDPNVIIESVVTGSGPQFEVVRGRLVAIARAQGLLK